MLFVPGSKYGKPVVAVVRALMFVVPPIVTIRSVLLITVVVVPDAIETDVVHVEVEIVTVCAAAAINVMVGYAK